MHWGLCIQSYGPNGGESLIEYVLFMQLVLHLPSCGEYLKRKNLTQRMSHTNSVNSYSGQADYFNNAAVLIFLPWVSHATKSKIQNNSLLYDIALPHFSTRIWGFYRGWSRVQMPSHAGKHLSPEFYYRVIFVQVFIICAGGEDQGHLLLGQFLPQQSSFLSIFPAAPYPYQIPSLGPSLIPSYADELELPATNLYLYYYGLFRSPSSI